jgi:large repetitive protein
MKKILFTRGFILSIIAFVLFPYLSYTQVPTCDSNVPYYFVDLSGNPAGIWVSPSHERIGKCCGVTGANVCTSFEVKLNPNTVAVNFNIASGATPSGALFYQIECGPEIPIGQQICLTGSGTHHITFCKPGNNENTYVITSIPKPIFPSDTTVRIGCSKTLSVLGITESSIGWTSVYPGVEGQYNSYLSCTNCTTSDFTPVDGAPAYIDYKICGLPLANDCGYNNTVCGTVRITINNRLTETISPSPASFCQMGSGSGITLTANPSGGNGNYNYIWRNSSSGIIGNSKSYFATAQGNYTVEVRDGLYCRSTRRTL